jgi:hypothetical protein
VFVIAAGMPKAGTAFAYNVLNGLLVAAGKRDARDIKRRRRLDRLMRWRNNNIGPPSLWKLFRLWRISLIEGPFVVKTHAAPTRALLLFRRLRLIKVIYGYRDPRDALLSAVDHGKRIRDKGRDHTFARLVDFEKAFRVVKSWIDTWVHYNNLDGTLRVRYEDLVTDPLATAKRMLAHLGLVVDDRAIEAVLAEHDKAGRPQSTSRVQHFHKGKCYRYRDEMPEEQKERFRAELGDVLLQMGYSLD